MKTFRFRFPAGFGRTRLAVAGLSSLLLAASAAASQPTIVQPVPDDQAQLFEVQEEAPGMMGGDPAAAFLGPIDFANRPVFRGGAVTWIAQGSGPIEGGQVEGMDPQNNPVSGAVQCVLPHPTDPNILYLGAVNGGVWKTTNATASAPTWTPLTDQTESLSIGALTADPTDATFQTILAGVGRFSSLSRIGGFRSGLLRSTNGGSSWSPIDGGGTLDGKNISGAVIRGNTIVVSVNQADSFTFPNIGIFRSTNGGTSFTQISGLGGSGLPSGLSFDVAADPADNARLYTPMAFSESAGGVPGIYRSLDTGATWTKVSNATMDALMDDGTIFNNCRLSVGTNNNVYVGIMNSGRLAGLFRSGDGGDNWTELDLPSTNENGTSVGLQPNTSPGGQGAIHFSIVADPVDHDIVYVGGDRQPLSDGANSGSFPNSIGANNYSGRLFRVDAGLASGSQGTALTHMPSTVSNSSPHADSRDMAFDANGNIIEGDDGGVYRRTQPRGTGDWFSVIGNLQNSEYHSVDYDSVSNVIIGGAQDTGTSEQVTEGSFLWGEITQGDGGVVGVDDVSRAGTSESVRFSSYQYLGAFLRRVVDSNNVTTSFEFPTLTINQTGNDIYTDDANIQFYTPFTLNAIDPSRGVLGTATVYESFDGFDTMDNLGFLNNFVNSMAYGGRKDGIDNEEVLYVCSGSGVGPRVHLRSTTGGPLNQLTAYPGGTPFDVTIDPDDWHRAFVMDADQVWFTNNAGTSFTDISGNLAAIGAIQTGARLRSIVYLPGPTEDAIVVGGPGGAYITMTSTQGTWSVLGSNLPNGLIADLRYDRADDLLLAGTLGRGAWTIPDVQSAIFGAVATPTPSPTASPTPSASPTATPSPSISPTASPTATASPSASPSASPTASATPTATASPSASPTASASPSPSPSPSTSPSPSPSPTASASPSPTPSPSPSPTVNVIDAILGLITATTGEDTNSDSVVDVADVRSQVIR